MHSYFGRHHLAFTAILLVVAALGLAACGSGGASGGSTTTVVAHAWTWEGGSSTVNAKGVYGTKGTAATTNIPGARDSAVAWTDSSGNFWLFGGYGYDSAPGLGKLNDLWMYNATTGEWTWKSGANTTGASGSYGTQGSAGASNVPGARTAAVGWTDSSGKLWLFGGSGYDSTGASGYLNDLWMYDPTTGEWTWEEGANTVSGATASYGAIHVAATTNVPGPRAGTVTWTDSSGKLWLFGGYGYDSATTLHYLNDLWVYDTTSHEWTWEEGSNTVDAVGTYGTQGTPDVSNVPGARERAIAWTDSSGNLWLFGGKGVDSLTNIGQLNDLWMYDPVGGKWAWESGSTTRNAAGVYGTKGTAAATNVPGAREGAVAWIDSSDNLWLFGGYGDDSVGSVDVINDLWMYSPTNGKWTWQAGSNRVNAVGVYGTKGTAATTNAPGARYYSASWIDSSGNLWLFGGMGYDPSASFAAQWFRDLWKYDP